MRLRRILAVIYLECLYLSRDRLTLAMVLGVPILQILLFGYAVRPLPRHVPVAVSGPDLRDHPLLRQIRSSQHYRVVAEGLPAGQASARARQGEVVIGLELHPLAWGGAAVLTVNDLDPALSEPALAGLEAIYLRAQVGGPGTGHLVQRLYNPGQRADWAMTPALSGVVVMISMLMLGSFSLVREREQGTWDTLMASPLLAVEALLGKLSPYLVLGVVQAVSVLLVGKILFQLPMRGALLPLIAFAAIFAAAHLVVGFAISARAATQVQAMQATVFFYLPCMLLSGFLVPFTNMPLWAQHLGNLLPLTHYVRISRSVLLAGTGGQGILRECLPVVLFCLVATGFALLSYRKGETR